MNIYEKISAVMNDIKYLSKDDTVAFGNTKYKAVSEEKVTSAIREKLIQHGLVIFPVKQDHKREGTLSTVDVTYRIVNIENPEESIEVVSSGTGVDTQDKGVGKAMTYAYKYMLLRTFAIPTGEDPDKVSSAQLDEEAQKRKEDSAKRSEATISADDVASLEKYIKDNRLSKDKILKSYKVSGLEQMSYGKMYAIMNVKHHGLFREGA